MLAQTVQTVLGSQTMEQVCVPALLFQIRDEIHRLLMLKTDTHPRRLASQLHCAPPAPHGIWTVPFCSILQFPSSFPVQNLDVHLVLLLS